MNPWTDEYKAKVLDDLARLNASHTCLLGEVYRAHARLWRLERLDGICLCEYCEEYRQIHTQASRNR